MTDIFRFKITLSHIEPPIWRRVDVPADWTLADLSMVIQDAFGWENRHLWEFDVNGERFGFYKEDDPMLLYADKAVLSQRISQGDEFTYTYDFGDGWRHEVELEERLESDEGYLYPRLVDGERAAPPEDSGGPPAFADAVRQMKSGELEPYLADWYGDFDPDDFDAQAIDLAGPWYAMSGDAGLCNRNRERAVTYGSHRVFMDDKLETYPVSNQLEDCLDRLPVSRLDTVAENIGLDDPPSRRGPRAKAMMEILEEPEEVDRLLDGVSREARKLFDTLSKQSDPIDVAGLVRGGWTRGERTWLLFDGRGALAELRRLGLAHLGTYRTDGETRYLVGVPIPVFPTI